MDGSRGAATKLGRLAVAVVLTALALYWSHPSAILSAVARADFRWLGAALALVLVDRALMAMRWIDLLVALNPGTRPPLGGVLRAFFVSSFVSNFIPTVGADLYRAYVLSRYDVHLAESTASVLMDRALGVLAVGLVGAAALPLAGSVAAQRELIVGLGIIFGICAVAVAVIYSDTVAEWLRGVARRIPIRAIHRVTNALTDAVRRYATHHRELTRVLVMSIAVQIIRVLQTWCLGIALGIHLPLLLYFVFVPIIVLIAQLPITINGFGTTQVAFRQLFVPQGAPAPEVFALSVLFLALGVIGSLPGGFFYAMDPPARRGARV